MKKLIFLLFCFPVLAFGCNFGVQPEVKTYEVFFHNSNMDSQSICERVFGVERQALPEISIYESAIRDLLKGPSDEEKKQGYFSNIPAGSKLLSMRVMEGKAEADFNQTTQSGGGSLSMCARQEEIKQTLLHLPEITSAKISVEGEADQSKIFQP